MRAALHTLLTTGLIACGSPVDVPDRWHQTPGVADNAFDAGEVPYASNGAPLRGPAVHGEWRMHLGAEHRSGTRLAPGIVTPRVRWSAEVGIQGYANSPLVTRDRVFATSQGSTHNQTDPEDGFYAIDRSDGSRVWFHPTNEDVNGGLLTDDFVIGGTDDGTLYAIDRDEGRLAWQAELGVPLYHAPLEWGRQLWVLGGDTIYALDPRNGSELGRTTIDGTAWEGRGALASDGEQLYFTTVNGAVGALDANGEVQWTVAIGDPDGNGGYTTHTYAPPVVLGERLLVTAPDLASYGSFQLRVALVSSVTGRSDWDLPSHSGLRALDGSAQPGMFYEMPFYAASAWLMSGRVWVPVLAADATVALDLSTGEAAAAFATRSCSSRQFPSIVGVPSRGYHARHDGTLLAFVPATGDVSWGLQLGTHSSAGTSVPPASARNRAASYCEGYPYDGSGLFSSPAIGEDGVLFVGTGDGWIYAIDDPRFEL